jgi:hypothetical protein
MIAEGAQSVRPRPSRPQRSLPLHPGECPGQRRLEVDGRRSQGSASTSPSSSGEYSFSFPFCCTCAAALDRGYNLTLIKDAHTTAGIDLGYDLRIEAAGIVAELNVTMTWLSYPGRKNGTATANEVDFAIPGGVR